MSSWFGRAGGMCARALCVCLFASGCGEGDRDGDISQLAELELKAGSLPASPTNAFADDAQAAAFGRKLFFDRRLSSEGTVACADCHDPSTGFSDQRHFSEGVREQEGARHSMPITTAALQPFLLWDGRADSVWRQPLYALENPKEMDFTRTDVALFIASEARADYEAVFGALPDLAGVPPRALPGHPAWESLTPEQQDDVQRVFVNVGKAIEAYERLLVCSDTKFDRWQRGEVDLDEGELAGAQQFVDSGCNLCHNGPAVSDGLFHNLGIERDDANAIDTGREAGLAALLVDDLNGASRYSDDPELGANRLAEAATETGTRGSFRTASLRGVTQRARFGHRGDHTDLADFIQETYNRRGRGGRGGDGDGNNDGDGGDRLGEIDPILDDVNVNGDGAREIVEFLRTLECAPPPPELLAP